ncbi:hypothetical protein N5C70_27295 [Pseudomonas juntendi]|uniref:Uncharacterized protein n=1 Tax=Pseudomonas juntendi TaxID=2666183 RepID=A0ABD4YNR6_9PSED|nr:hypothetical protein [Pseudomonas juntendi]MDH0760370.1 hypothetical protein [Pseudomonas juntendi]MDH1917825.1 hypothetical protein [Pseudomonas juntendi]
MSDFLTELYPMLRLKHGSTTSLPPAWQRISVVISVLFSIKPIHIDWDQRAISIQSDWEFAMSKYLDTAGRYHVENFVPFLFADLRMQPAHVADLVMSRAKYAAKILSAIAPIKYCRALDVVAYGLGFSTWFDFRRHLREVDDGVPASDSWCTKMAAAFLLLGCRDANVRIPIEHLQGVELIAKRISIITGLPRTKVLDQLCARLCSAGTWAEVVNRSPLHASEPLYTFSVRWGHFEESPACRQLSEDMYEIRDGSGSMEFVQWLEFTVSVQPTFIEGAMQLGWYYLTTGQAAKALAVTGYSAEHMISLIPDEYYGDVSYWGTCNRPFLRLLNTRMLAHESLGQFTSALLVAECLLGFSPTDGMLTRFEIMRLLKKMGRADLALEWGKYIRKLSYTWEPILRDQFLSELVGAPVAPSNL